jgi:hypothetical protein
MLKSLLKLSTAVLFVWLTLPAAPVSAMDGCFSCSSEWSFCENNGGVSFRTYNCAIEEYCGCIDRWCEFCQYECSYRWGATYGYCYN